MYSYDEIIGNEQIIKNLQNAAAVGKASHAYIFHGAFGMGKMLLAKTFAKALQCEKGTGIACGQCVSCRAFDSGNHPDVFYIEPAKTKALGVEDIREQIGRTVDIKPYKYQRKIYILKNADRMTAQAQNALLKTLEEPPAYAVFLLLSENLDGFLPTVLSRCVVMKLRGVASKQITDYLVEKEMTSPEEAGLYAEYAQGSIGRAQELIHSLEFGEMRSTVLNCLKSLKQKTIVEAMLMVKALEPYKEDLAFLDMMYLWYRDIFTVKRLRSTEFLIEKDIEDDIVRQAEIESLEGLSHKIDAVWQAKRQLARNGNFQLTLEVLLIKLKESE